jgi:hypothetical protein
VGSSYDLVGGASSYLRSGLSALLMFLPRVGRGIRDFADLRSGPWHVVQFPHPYQPLPVQTGALRHPSRNSACRSLA